MMLPTPDNAQTLLESLRWREDMMVTNPFGEVVWLKALFREGERIGITDCCLADDPCSRHQNILTDQEGADEGTD